ncbi:MAG: IS5 family transposase [Acidobacteriaceae bacterium]|nr:IS5 family transposase [Acidobacteriaceae bacterium]
MYLESRGVKLGTGTIVDATLIEAPSSTKNKSGERDPEMHQTRKGNQWHFGMKAHVGVDAETKLVHTVAATAANVADSKLLPELLRGDEMVVWGDQAYQGQAAVLAEHAPRAEDRTCRRWRSKLHVWPEQREANRIHSKTRSRVEHIFAVLKLRFGFVKVRYRGLLKNLNRLHTSFALVNLITAQKHLAVLGQ